MIRYFSSEARFVESCDVTDYGSKEFTEVRSSVAKLVSKFDARKWKTEFPKTKTSLDTSFYNDKRQFLYESQRATTNA